MIKNDEVMIKKVLTIAGSDCSGGAGIQADIKTITVHKMYAMSVITALTAQNTTGVYGVQESSPEFVSQQLSCVFEDIRPDAVKIGMVSNSDIIKVIAEKLIQYKAENIVVDPVMVATSGGKLMHGDAVESLIKYLLPLAKIITPNIPEAEELSGMKISTVNDLEMAAILIAEKMKKSDEILQQKWSQKNSSQGSSLQNNAPQKNEKSYMQNTAILIKGGHFEDVADDLLHFAGENRSVIFHGEHIANPNTHGTGCTLSSAIACNLANGLSVEDSVKNAKEFITNAIRAGLNIGQGSGPLNHMWAL